MSRTGSNEGGRHTAEEEDGTRLPLCPKGNVDYSTVGPCRKRKSGRGRKKRGSIFRVPLKKEDGNMESQIVEYNCEFPNRVVVRMEYLMQSTKVRLNDRHFMDDFYAKLMDEERRALEKATRAREKAELNRMKKHIIDGDYPDIPPELSYLHSHPVFRVNQMLNRLTQYENELLIVGSVDEEDEITPVEPYEFDGNKFFKHLHDEGNVWIPAFQQKYEKEKLQGKVYRARLRLEMKKREQEADEKVLRLMNAADDDSKDDESKPSTVQASASKTATVRLLLVDDIKEQEKEDRMLSSALKMETSKPMSNASIAATRIQAKVRQDIVNLQEKIKKSKEAQEKRDAQLDLKRHELDYEFVDTFNYDYHRVMTRYAERQKQRNAEQILENGEQPDAPTPASTASSKSSKKAPTKKLKPYEEMFVKKVDSNLELTGKPDVDLFNKLKMHFEVPGKYPFHQYKEFDNKLIKHLNTISDGKKMIEYAQEVVNMCIREQLVVEDFANDERSAN